MGSLIWGIIMSVSCTAVKQERKPSVETSESDLVAYYWSKHRSVEFFRDSENKSF